MELTFDLHVLCLGAGLFIGYAIGYFARTHPRPDRVQEILKSASKPMWKITYIPEPDACNPISEGTSYMYEKKTCPHCRESLLLKSTFEGSILFRDEEQKEEPVE